MITSLREKDYQAKKEGESKFSAEARPPPSTSRQWSAFRNPRIVRVSRTFGGKDRHSKVCTIRGLRDRRIRLSVPTAIELYDLQDRLGLGQPSKVIDWLIDVTKSDIDKLPPLSLPQGFGQFQHHPALMFSQESSNAPPHQSPLAPFFEANSTFMKDARFHSSLGLNINNGEHHHFHGEEHQQARMKSKHWEVEASSLRAKNKVVEDVIGKGKWIKGNDQENNQDGVIGKLFPLSSTQSNSLPGLLNNPTLPFNSYYHWDASNLSLSQFGSHGFLPQPENSINTNTVPSSSSPVLPSGPQLFFCPPPTMPSLFPSFSPYNVTPSVENDQSREINHFQLLGPSSQHFLPNFRTSTKPFSLNANPDKDNSSS